MWSLEYSQVPIERKLKRCPEVSSQDKVPEKDEKDSANEASKKLDLFKQMKSMSSNEGNGRIFFV